MAIIPSYPRTIPSTEALILGIDKVFIAGSEITRTCTFPIESVVDMAADQFITSYNNRLVVETISGWTLTNADSGGIIIFKTVAAQTLIIPEGLVDGFECSFVTTAGTTLTVSPAAGVILNNAVGTKMASGLSFTLKRMLAANTFIASGNL